jgi:hypothetical protein
MTFTGPSIAMVSLTMPFSSFRYSMAAMKILPAKPSFWPDQAGSAMARPIKLIDIM